MSTTYGKWEPNHSGMSVQRTVTTERWPLGFHWKRVRVDFINCAPDTDTARLCRALNGEPEPAPPEPKLDEPWALTTGATPSAVFAFKHHEYGTGGDRRKATNERGHSCDAKGHGTETCPACQAYWRGYRQAEHNAKPKRRGKR